MISKTQLPIPVDLPRLLTPPSSDETPGFRQFGGDHPRLRGPDDPHTLTKTGIPHQVYYPHIVSTQEITFKFRMLETFQE